MSGGGSLRRGVLRGDAHPGSVQSQAARGLSLSLHLLRLQVLSRVRAKLSPRGGRPPAGAGRCLRANPRAGDSMTVPSFRRCTFHVRGVCVCVCVLVCTCACVSCTMWRRPREASLSTRHRPAETGAAGDLKGLRLAFLQVPGIAALRPSLAC